MNKIEFKITEDAQKAAARAGLPAAVGQEIELPTELVGRALDLGATIGEEGSVTLTPWVVVRAAAKGESTQERLDSLPTTAEEALDAIEALVAQAAKIAGEEEAARRERAEHIAAEVLASEPAPGADGCRAFPELLTPATVAALEKWNGCRDVAEQEREAGYAAQIAAYEAGGEYPEITPGISDELCLRRSVESERRRLTAEMGRLIRLAELVSGMPIAAERVAAGPGPLGLLPEEEALKLIRDTTLPVGEGLVEYRRIKIREIRAHCQCEYGDMYEGETSCLAKSPEDAGGLTAEEWEMAMRIQTALVAADIGQGEIRLHRGECDDERCPAWPVRRVGVLIKLDLGGDVTVEREYGSPEDVKRSSGS